jgi:hypothetical protein
MDAEELGMQQALLKGSNRNTAVGGLEEAISRTKEGRMCVSRY